MIKTSTENEMIRFLYKESSLEEEQQILEAVDTDESLKEELMDFGFLKNQIDKVIIKAPDRVVDKILSFSKQSNLESA